MRSVTVDSIKYIFYSITQVVLTSIRPSITTQVILASARSSSITYWASITTSPDNTQLESILCVIKPTSFTTHTIFNLSERNEKKSLASTSIKLKILKLGYLVR